MATNWCSHALSSLPQDEHYIDHDSVNSKRAHPPPGICRAIVILGGGRGGKLQMPHCGAGQFIQKTQNCIF